MDDKVTVVDLFDNIIGEAEKMYAHKNKILHRAFSVFLFQNNKMMIQKRNINKYHSGGLWTNACCSHPRPGEELQDAVKRRLKEELGISCEVRHLYQFTYYEDYNGIYEYENDHVFIGEYQGNITINLDEIDEFKWVDLVSLSDELCSVPEMFTKWFIIAAPVVIKELRNIK